MPLNVNDVVRMTLRGVWQNQLWVHVWHYEVMDGTGGDGMVDAAEDWWNTYKSAYRTMFLASSGLTTNEVVAERLAGDGEFSVYAIPTAEQQGTRTGVTGEFMPSFVAGGVKFNVANRLTRPGSKRMPGLMEADVVQNALQADYKTLLSNWASLLLVNWGFLVQLDTVTLRPGVYGTPNLNRLTAVFNPFTGALVNNNATSQVSRKFGRGR